MLGAVAMTKHGWRMAKEWRTLNIESTSQHLG